jgi:hypothetical protein
MASSDKQVELARLEVELREMRRLVDQRLAKIERRLRRIKDAEKKS